MTEFHYALDADGVATITWDVPGKSMNVMSFEGLRELDACIDKALADDAVKGVVITSGKADFAGGMDLNVLADMRDNAGDNPAQGLFEGQGLEAGQRVDRDERLQRVVGGHCPCGQRDVAAQPRAALGDTGFRVGDRHERAPVNWVGRDCAGGAM